MNDSYLNYLNDTLKQLISRAKEIKNDNELDQGRRIAYYELISTLLNQAEAFGILETLDDEIKNLNVESLI